MLLKFNLDASSYYLLITLLILAFIAVSFFVIRPSGNKKNFTPLYSLAVVFLFSGIFFGDEQWVGYSLIGAGMLMAIVEMVGRYKARH